jgi:hypothetical protein
MIETPEILRQVSLDILHNKLLLLFIVYHLLTSRPKDEISVFDAIIALGFLMTFLVCYWKCIKLLLSI